MITGGNMVKARRYAQIGRECVACGSCLKVCPKGAVRIVSGVIARVDQKICVGCGKCARICPADVITIVERGAEK